MLDQKAERRNLLLTVSPNKEQRSKGNESTAASSNCTSKDGSRLDSLSRSFASDGSVKADSQCEFMEARQTILLLDWDDTLCPSSFCRHQLPEQLICKVWQECCNLPDDGTDPAASVSPSKKGASGGSSSSSASPKSAVSPQKGGEKVTKLSSGKSGQSPNGKVTPASAAASSAMPSTYVEAWDIGRQGLTAEEINIAPNEQLAASVSDSDDAPSEPILSPRHLRGREKAREYYMSMVSTKHRTQLDSVADRLIALLRRAKQLGRVVIVTNAETGWIELSCKAWLNKALPEVLSCRLVSARSSYEQPSGSKSPAGWKADAFRDVVREFYIARSWKNILSIGDAPHEREAVFRIQSDSNHPMCRVKSVKLQVRPKVPEVLRQMSRLQESLESIIHADCNLDLEFMPDTGGFEDMLTDGELLF
ncbi:unnamed protein product [Amoebophrya sp. A25]|nr:unnamed protein product [Amoebophrya sp. A25]|eukprot:GSA25T00020772001.1